MKLGAGGATVRHGAKDGQGASRARQQPTRDLRHGARHRDGGRGVGHRPGRRQRRSGSDDLAVAREYKAGLNEGILCASIPVYRFPVLVSWDFTCTGDGGFERLMNDLDVGLLGTVDETTSRRRCRRSRATGHVALDPPHPAGRGRTVVVPRSARPRSRPCGPGRSDGVLPLAHTGDQLRKVVPDGREDISLAALFEIGRLLDAEQADSGRCADAVARASCSARRGHASSPTRCVGVDRSTARASAPPAAATPSRNWCALGSSAPSPRSPPDALAPVRPRSRPPGCRTSSPTSAARYCSDSAPTRRSSRRRGKTFGVDGLRRVPVARRAGDDRSGRRRTSAASRDADATARPARR